MKRSWKELSKSSSEDDRKDAIALLEAHLAQHPDDGVAWFSKACCHDFIGDEKTAESCYRKCYEHDWKKLPLEDQKRFFVGYGSTLRNNLKYAESAKILEEGIAHFKDYPALKAFLAFSYYSQKQDKLAAETLFDACVDAAQKGFDGYERAIKWYADHLKDHPEPRK